MLRLVILGYGPLGLALTRAAMAMGPDVHIIGVFPWSYHPRYSHAPPDKYDAELIHFLNTHHVPILRFKSVNHFQFVQFLRAMQPHVVLVGSWGEILKPFVLEQPDIHFINCHPSLLPRHKGPNPYSQVILQGDAQSGVTFHHINAGIDTGPLLMQEPLPVFPTDTVDTLRQRCADLACTMLPGLLQNLTTLSPQPQDENAGSYEPVDDTLAWIRWQDPPLQIERRLRATAPWCFHVAQVGRHVIEFRAGSLESYDSTWRKGDTPGIIVHRTWASYWVSTIDPHTVVRLDRPVWFGWPDWLTQIICLVWLRPGCRFTTINIKSTVSPR